MSFFRSNILSSHTEERHGSRLLYLLPWEEGEREGEREDDKNGERGERRKERRMRRGGIRECKEMMWGEVEKEGGDEERRGRETEKKGKKGEQ